VFVFDMLLLCTRASDFTASREAGALPATGGVTTGAWANAAPAVMTPANKADVRMCFFIAVSFE
jgi:hypothetical protein